MADRGDTIDLHELVVSNMISIEALVTVLLEKGLVSQEELLGAVAVVRQEMVGKARAGNVEQGRRSILAHAPVSPLTRLDRHVSSAHRATETGDELTTSLPLLGGRAPRMEYPAR